MKYGIKLASENSIFIAQNVSELQNFVEDRVLGNSRAIRSTNDALAMCANNNVLVLFGIGEIRAWLSSNGACQFHETYHGPKTRWMQK
jgi:hypothetical protein